MSYEDFKNRYLDMIVISNNCIEESFAVSQLERVLKDKDYDEIDTVFQLYLVQKQENDLLSKFIPEEALPLYQSDPNVANLYLSDKQASDLELLRTRKSALQARLDGKDAQTIIDLQTLLKDKKIRVLNDLAANTSADDI